VEDLRIVLIIPCFSKLVPPGVNNAALIYGLEVTYILTGPGAGATPPFSDQLCQILITYYNLEAKLPLFILIKTQLYF